MGVTDNTKIITHPFKRIVGSRGFVIVQHRPAWNRFYVIGFWKLVVVSVWLRPFRMKLIWPEGEDES